MTKLTPIPASGARVSCVCCGAPSMMFPADACIAVGFGYAGLTKDGEEIYSEPMGPDDVPEDAYMTGAQAEALAAADPDHDWRIVLHGPLSGRTYQRHGEGQWPLVLQDEGFA